MINVEVIGKKSRAKPCCLGHLQGSKHRRSCCWDCQCLSWVQSMPETNGLCPIPTPSPDINQESPS